MTIRLILFALARDLVGVGEMEIDVAAGATIADLRAQLRTQYPQLAGVLARSLFAINAEYAAEHQILTPNAEVACIPPVSGG